MALIAYDGAIRALNDNGDPISGAKLYLYESGTTTPIVSYSDSAMTISHTSPVVANSVGVFPSIYTANTSCKIDIETSNGVSLSGFPVDNIIINALQITPEYSNIDSLKDEAATLSVGSIQKTTSGNLYKVATSTATDADITGTNNKFYEYGPSFTTLSRFKAAIARGDAYESGREVIAGGGVYHFLNDANTDITGLTGWELVASKSTTDAIAVRATSLEGRTTVLESYDAGTRITALEGTQTTGTLVRPLWSELEVDVGVVDGSGAEVLDTDTGTHLAASATGYDGAVISNAGRYSWDDTWSRWVRIGNSGLAEKADQAFVDRPNWAGIKSGWTPKLFNNISVGEDFNGRARWTDSATEEWEIVDGAIFPNGKALKRKVDGVSGQQGLRVYFDDMGAATGDTITMSAIVTGDGGFMRFDGRFFLANGAFGASFGPADTQIVTTSSAQLVTVEFTIPAGYVGVVMNAWQNDASTVDMRIEAFWAYKGSNGPTWPVSDADLHQLEVLKNHGNLVYAVPPTIHYVEGIETKIFFDQLISTNIDAIGFDCANLARGQQDKDGWRLNIANGSGVTGGAKISVRNKENLDIIADLGFSFDHSSATAGDGQTKNVMFIGDSITRNGYVIDEVLRGNTGGALTVTPHGTVSAPSRSTSGLVVAPPVEVGNVNEGHAGQRIGYFVGASGPFWNGTTTDFSAYCTANSIPALDDVIIQLGTNDITTVADDAALYAAIPTWLADYDTLIDDILTQDPSLEVGIVPIPLPTLNQDAQGDDYGINLDMNLLRRNAVIFNNALIKHFKGQEGGRKYIVPSWTNWDAVNDIQRTLGPRNPFNPFNLETVALQATQEADLTPNDGSVFECTDSGQFIVKRGKTGQGGYDYAGPDDGIIWRANNGVHPGASGGAAAGRYVRGYLMSKY